MIKLIELKKVLSQELKCLCSKTTTVLSGRTIRKTVDVVLLHFYCIKNKLIYCMEMYVYCIEMYIIYVYYMYSIYVLYMPVYPLVV